MEEINNKIKYTEIKGMKYNEYHKMYYIEKIKGCKTLCECGLSVDKFRFARHRRSKQHLRKLEQQIINESFTEFENNILK